MTAHYDRALSLYQQSRYDLAEQELRQALANQPNDAFAHALLALCLCHRKDYPAAMREAEEATHLTPAGAKILLGLFFLGTIASNWLFKLLLLARSRR